MQPRMELKKESLPIMVKGTSVVTDPIETSNMTFSSKVVWVPLNPTRTLIGF